MKDIIVYDSSGKQINTLVQWDREVYITIRETYITSAHKVHFFNSESDMALVVSSTYSSGVLTVKVPDVLLMKSLEINGYVYEEGSNDAGQSIARFRINIRQRPKPSDYIYSNTIDYISYSEILLNCQAFSDAEALRVSAESSRESAELSRVSAESGRVSAEQNRVSEEQNRVSSENIRISNEEIRDSAETLRQSAEDVRVSAETERNTAEENRVSAFVNALGINEIIIEDATDDKKYVYQLAIEDGHIGIKFIEINT